MDDGLSFFTRDGYQTKTSLVANCCTWTKVGKLKGCSFSFFGNRKGLATSRVVRFLPLCDPMENLVRITIVYYGFEFLLYGLNQECQHGESYSLFKTDFQRSAASDMVLTRFSRRSSRFITRLELQMILCVVTLSRFSGVPYPKSTWNLYRSCKSKLNCLSERFYFEWIFLVQYTCFAS